jgi:hypothetical protein
MAEPPATGEAPGKGSLQVAAAIVTEIRARREGLADDERRTRRYPRSRQILTGRQHQAEAALIDGLLLALTHAIGKPYNIIAAERLISRGATDGQA